MCNIHNKTCVKLIYILYMYIFVYDSIFIVYVHTIYNTIQLFEVGNFISNKQRVLY